MIYHHKPRTILVAPHSLVRAKGNSQKKLSHGSPQSVGMDKDKMDSIGDLVQEAFAERITPGAVVLIARDNKII